MSVFFPSAPPSTSVSFLTHRSSTTIICCSSLQTLPQPLSQPQPSLSQPSSSNSLPANPKTSHVSSSGCSLNCPHFDSCSGCTHEDNLHRPVILQEATTFFKKHGVSDFTFDTCRLNCMALLSSKAWHLSKAHGFNFFPGTHSIEILAVFKRGPGTSVKKKKSGKKKKNKPS